MNIEFLGTGTSQGIPVIGCTCSVCTSSDSNDKRNRCAAVITEGGTTLLIDSGPDIRLQLLRAGISRVDGVLITHEHYDHTGGLDDLRPIGFNYNGIHLYGQPKVLEQIKLKYNYAFGEQKYPGTPEFHLNPVNEFEVIHFDNIQVKPVPISHGNLNIMGYCFNEKLVYITDANGIPETTLDEIRNKDTLIINALHHTPHHSHFTLAQTLNVIQKINPRRAYIIHISHHMGLHKEVSIGLPENVFLAFDTCKLEM